MEAPVIKVSSDLRGAHIEVRKMKQQLADGFTDATGLINSLRNHRVLRVKVSKPQIDRALRIADALIKALEGRGAKFVSVEGSDLKEVRIEGERIECHIMEETKRVVHVAKKGESSLFQRQWDFHATGRLRFEIVEYTPAGGLKKWVDGERSQLEDHLGEIVVRLFEVAADLKKWGAEREAQARRRREEEQVRQDEERRRQAELGFRKNLEEQAKCWALSKDVAAFVEACERELGKGGQVAMDGWAARWLAWAREHAARLDPIRAGFLESEGRRLAESGKRHAQEGSEG